jgi:hypothetical protein
MAWSSTHGMRSRLMSSSMSPCMHSRSVSALTPQIALSPASEPTKALCLRPA